jgi:hypothetical protein
MTPTDRVRGGVIDLYLFERSVSQGGSWKRTLYSAMKHLPGHTIIGKIPYEQVG